MFLWRKLLKNIIYPHIVVVVILTATSFLGLIYSFAFNNAIPVLQYLSYIVSAYTLTIICFRVPKIITYFKLLKKENKYLQKWFSDVHLRMNVSLYGSLILNISFAIFQLVLGFYHKSFWFYSLFVYYIMLAIMRFFIVKHTRIYKTNEQEKTEIKKYLLCGKLLLVMNLALALIVFFIVYWNRTFYHNMITTIVIAAYTFTTFSVAIVNLIKYKKYKRPIYSAAKIISLIAASVSILTLETTMLTTFGTTENLLFNQIMLSITGISVIGFAITMAIIMIVRGNKALNIIQNRLKIN